MNDVPLFELGEDPIWVRAADAFSRPGIAKIKTHSILHEFISEIDATIARTGRPPVIRKTIWAIQAGLKSGEPSSEASAVLDALDSFDRICANTFQTLQEHDLFRSLLSVQGLTSDRVATSIWVDWCRDRAQCPVTATFERLNEKHWELGLGCLFGTHPGSDDVPNDVGTQPVLISIYQ